MTKLTKKQRHQVKSRWYYLFWGAATVSVFAGQMYVGSGYRRMAKSFDRIMDAIVITIEDEFTITPRRPRHPMLIDPLPHWGDSSEYDG